MTKNRQILLASRPTGWPTEANFKLVETPVPQPAEGQVLVRNHFLSLDPYMRARMDAVKSYARSVEVGEVMVGGAVGEVLESRSPRFAKGDFVVGALGWQEYAAADAGAVTKVDTKLAPPSVYLGALGMPGVTAWTGLIDICRPKAGETVVVSAASGAVGSVVGQLAKAHGCRAVGVAGGAKKCAYVTGELGFDACIDYKAGNLHADLKAATPDGIDVYFDNVGGETLDAALARMNPFGRVAICGLISQYNATEPYGVRNFRSVLVNRLKVQGFIVSDRMELWPQALAELTGLFAQGRLKYRESVALGLENAPAAFLGMLRGENFGKQVVKLV
ncbi:MAG: NADP-dependent oxidoreductase [Burkholderiales bacterium]|nr:NADP-dependent oxidoreductase [Burkholderiales bacterium]